MVAALVCVGLAFAATASPSLSNQGEAARGRTPGTPSDDLSNATWARRRDECLPGIQSTLAPRHLALLTPFQSIQDPLARAGAVVAWKARFTNQSAGGRLVGRRTVDEILDSRTLTGCHDHGLLLAALLRALGHPARLVDCAGLAWARTPPEERRAYIGHVFVETELGGKWFCLDSTSDRYFPCTEIDSPFIPFPVGNEAAFGVLFRGVDPAAYGVTHIRILNEAMDRFSERLRASNIPPAIPPVELKRLPRE